MVILKGNAMEQFVNYLQLKGYAENTVSSYTYAASQLRERCAKLSDQSLLAHKEWLISSFAPKTANNRIGAINAYLDFIAFNGIRLKGVRIQQKQQQQSCRHEPPAPAFAQHAPPVFLIVCHAVSLTFLPRLCCGLSRS